MTQREERSGSNRGPIWQSSTEGLTAGGEEREHSGADLAKQYGRRGAGAIGGRFGKAV